MDNAIKMIFCMKPQKGRGLTYMSLAFFLLFGKKIGGSVYTTVYTVYRQVKCT